MIGMAGAVHADVIRITRELLFILALQHARVAGLRQNAVEEFDVGRMVPRVKIVVEGMSNDQHPVLLHYRHAAIHIVEISKGHHLHEQRI